MDKCPYCEVELDDSEASELHADDEDFKLLWRHPGMECPELGELTFRFPPQN